MCSVMNSRTLLVSIRRHLIGLFTFHGTTEDTVCTRWNRSNPKVKLSEIIISLFMWMRYILHTKFYFWCICHHDILHLQILSKTQLKRLRSLTTIIVSFTKMCISCTYARAAIRVRQWLKFEKSLIKEAA